MYMEVKLDAYALHALFYGCSDSVRVWIIRVLQHLRQLALTNRNINI